MLQRGTGRGFGSKKKVFIVIISVTVVICTAVIPLYADIYRYIDSQGVLHFTNTPTSSDYRLYIRERPPKVLGLFSTDKYDHLITEASARYGVSFSLLKAMIKVESEFDPRAVSRAGANGLMQIMPENIKAFDIKDPFNPRENIMGGARYFRKLLKHFDGKLPLALAAYNAGPSMVDRYKDIPPIKETEDFVKKVMKYYYVFKKG